MIIKLRNKKIRINLKKPKFFGRIFGLMFRTRNTDNLLFAFNKDIKISFHSWFVFFNFIVLYLDSNDRIIEFKLVKPFTFSIECKKKFRKVVEIPVNEKNKHLLSFLNLLK